MNLMTNQLNFSAALTPACAICQLRSTPTMADTFKMSALIINDVPIECINQAAVEYHIPALLIISVLKTENGRNGSANVNRNGTIDYGPMQINSSWLPTIVGYGYTLKSLQYNPCANVAVGAWILASEIANTQTIHQGIGNFHSHTPSLGVSYESSVEYRYLLLNHYLQTEN